MSPRAVIPRGQVTIPQEIRDYLDNLYNMKGGITGFSKRSGIKSDTVRLAMKRGTTTAGTLKRMTTAVEKLGVPVLPAKGGRADAGRPAGGNGQGEAVVQIDQLPPAILRQVQRVSGALIDGMQLMQLTLLKALQEELGEGHAMLPPRLLRPR